MTRFLLCLTLLLSQLAYAQPLQKLTLVLDWFANPNHAPIFVAEQQGFFAEQGLELTIISPSNPADPPKLVAAGKADIALDYQPHLLLEIAQGLPLAQLGSLIDQPLSSLAVLASSPIKQMTDLKGRRIAYSSGGIDSVMLKIMLKTNGLTTADVEQVAVGYGLSQALLSGKVDAVIGVMRNVEPWQLAELNHPVRQFYPEDNGFPAYAELVFTVHKNQQHTINLQKFLTALQQGVTYLQQHPEESWQKFATTHPELNNDLNHRIWLNTLPYFSKKPSVINTKRCMHLAQALSVTTEVCQEFSPTH